MERFISKELSGTVSLWGCSLGWWVWVLACPSGWWFFNSKPNPCHVLTEDLNWNKWFFDGSKEKSNVVGQGVWRAASRMSPAPPPAGMHTCVLSPRATWLVWPTGNQQTRVTDFKMKDERHRGFCFNWTPGWLALGEATLWVSLDRTLGSWGTQLCPFQLQAVG